MYSIFELYIFSFSNYTFSAQLYIFNKTSYKNDIKKKQYNYIRCLYVGQITKKD